MPTPSKFNAARREAIIEAKRVGASDRTAAQVAGIHHETLRDWLERGRRAESGTYAEFYDAHQKAEAEPKLRALGVIWRAVEEKPDLAWKFVERRESGFAPPAPIAPPAQGGPVMIHLSLEGGGPTPKWAESEVIDAQEVPALSDGSGSAASAE